MGFLPFGFVYPDELKIDGVHYDLACPDPKIEAIRERMEWLNDVIEKCQTPAPVAAAALDLFQSLSSCGKKDFWVKIMAAAAPADIAPVVDAIAVKNGVTAAAPLDFPNAIALVDCRFVDTKEWEHLRRYSIGGSDAATILGFCHYHSPRSIYYDKTGVRVNVLDSQDWQRQHILDYGHFVEDHVIDSFAGSVGAKRIEEHRSASRS